MKKIELLAPAGDKNCVIAAVNAGADAIYLAGEKYGARAYAENFSEEELIRIIREAHVYHVRVFLTANVLTRQSELRAATEFVRRLHEEGLDGVIVQDLGLADAIHRACPSLKIHASTQMSVTTAEGVRFLKFRGIRRVVPARELSLSELQLLKNEGIEIEAFIHGAMCYAYSGRCLFSSFLGGRSGNRGRCAGTCRLPFDILDEEKQEVLSNEYPAGTCYPLSMKDLSVLTILPEILDAGADSLKIEGRMKKPEYVAGVTALYRKYLDRFAVWDQAGRTTPWVVDPGDLEMLDSLYIRMEQSTGYYKKRNGRDLITMEKGGYKGASEELLTQIYNGYCAQYVPKEVEAFVSLLPGEPAKLTVRAKDGKEGRALGSPVQEAKNRPLSKDDIAKQLCKTGDYPFRLPEKAITYEVSDRAFLAVSELNALRRAALDDLMKAYRVFPEEEESAEAAETSGAETMPAVFETSSDDEADFEKGLYAQVQTLSQYRGALAGGIPSVILDVAGDDDFENKILSAERSEVLSPGVRHLLALPPVFRESARPYLEKVFRAVAEGGFDGILVRTVEEMVFLREHGYAGKILSDSSCYHWNRGSKKVLSALANGTVLPHELRIEELAETFLDHKKETDFYMLPIYGRVELMVTAGCIKKSAGRCDGKGGYLYYRDRREMDFPAHCVCGEERRLCTNVIYNAVPTSLHGSLDDALLRKADAFRLSFTTETEDETREICSFFKDGILSGRGDAKRLPALLKGDGTKQEERTFTTGHFHKGAS